MPGGVPRRQDLRSLFGLLGLMVAGVIAAAFLYQVWFLIAGGIVLVAGVCLCVVLVRMRGNILGRPYRQGMGTGILLVIISVLVGFIISIRLNVDL